MDEEYSSLMNYTWDLYPLPKGRKLVWCCGCTVQSILQMVILIGTRHIFLWRVFHRLRVLITLRPFLLSSRWIISTLYSLIQLLRDGQYLRWMRRVSFCMETYMGIYICSNLMVLCRNFLWFANFEGLYMGSNKPLELGMGRWIPYYLLHTSLSIILILQCTFNVMGLIYWYLCYLLMILLLQVAHALWFRVFSELWESSLRW